MNDLERKERSAHAPGEASRPFGASALLALLLIAGAAVAWSACAPEDPAFVEWPEASPKREGLDPGALQAFADSLAARGTKELVVVRGGKLVYEWYAPGFDAAHRHYTAAMAKGAFAVPTLIAASEDGLVSLDDHVAAWVPSWASDSKRAKITLRDLAFHASGMDDVDFDAGAEGELTGWKKRYFDHPEERFRFALDSAGFIFAPGSRFSYSGVGYYVISYVLGKALHDSAASANIPSYVETTVYGPLGVPPEAWSIGYGRSDTIDGIPLTHLGSGGEMTARAAARIGQLFLDRGCWDGRRILPAGLVDTALGRHGVAPRAPDDAAAPGSGMGWWTNDNETWPDAPRSAVAAIGSGHQVVWIDPGLDLVVVRLGASLGDPGESFYEALGRHFVTPLYAALGAGPSREGDESVASAPREEGSESPSCAD